MSEETALTRPIPFACPQCKRPLRPDGDVFCCRACDRTYPIVDGIPDFILDDAPAGSVPSLRNNRKLAKFLNIRRITNVFNVGAPLYETRFWYPFFLNLVGAGSTSLSRIAGFHAKTLEAVTGHILDVACGPATYGRRIAASSRHIYGIDVSTGMLRQGLAYLARDHITGVHLAQARVEQLPFENAVFDGAICSGSLHLFPDTALALREVARTLKTGAPLSVQTFVPKDPAKRSGVFAYTLPELQQAVADAGFEGFQYNLDGTSITFSARKASSGSH